MKNDQSKSKYNDYGQKFSTERPFSKTITAQFQYLNVSEFTIITDLYDYHGETLPLWVVVDEDETIVDVKERFINEFTFTSDLNFKNDAFSLYNTSIALREVI